MRTTLDGQNLFDEQELEIEAGSLSRDSVERAVPGLGGVLSIDIGGRSRKIKQAGVLRAQSRLQMTERIGAISAYMDGDTHTLVIRNGEEFDNLRMDLFKVTEERTSGGGVAVDYEIVYTQLVI
ncbi:MAG: hypothetical protein ACYSUC_00860 [Planctomycetota bacterium]|jgi:hypothetical protein